MSNGGRPDDDEMPGASAEKARGPYLKGEPLPVRSRYYERFGEQGLGLPTYGGLGVTYDPGAERAPKGYVRSDERLREQVCERLTDHDAIDASGIEVSVNEGEVTLEGTVDDLETKHAAEDVAASVAGVRDVNNRLRRRRPGWGG